MQKFLYIFLNFFAPVLDRRIVRQLNHPVRLFLVFFFIPLLQQFLKKKLFLSNDFRIVCRHSIKDKDSYNFLYSDLDLSIILSVEQIYKHEEIRRILFGIKKYLIFMGEFEIYTLTEFEDVRKNMDILGEDFLFLRNLRKIGWIEDDLQNFKTPYHKKKATRSLEKIFMKYHVPFRQAHHNHVTQMSSAVEEFLLKFDLVKINEKYQKKFVNYLGFTVAKKSEQLELAERGLKLNANQCLILLSLIPFQSEDADLDFKIRALRENSKIFDFWSNLLEIEILTLTAVYRGNTEKFPWMPCWIDKLKEMRCTWNPIDIK